MHKQLRRSIHLLGLAHAHPYASQQENQVARRERGRESIDDMMLDTSDAPPKPAHTGKKAAIRNHRTEEERNRVSQGAKAQSKSREKEKAAASAPHLPPPVSPRSGIHQQQHHCKSEKDSLFHPHPLPAPNLPLIHIIAHPIKPSEPLPRPHHPRPLALILSIAPAERRRATRCGRPTHESSRRLRLAAEAAGTLRRHHGTLVPAAGGRVHGLRCLRLPASRGGVLAELGGGRCACWWGVSGLCLMGFDRQGQGWYHTLRAHRIRAAVLREEGLRGVGRESGLRRSG